MVDNDFRSVSRHEHLAIAVGIAIRHLGEVFAFDEILEIPDRSEVGEARHLRVFPGVGLPLVDEPLVVGSPIRGFSRGIHNTTGERLTIIVCDGRSRIVRGAEPKMVAFGCTDDLEHHSAAVRADAMGLPPFIGIRKHERVRDRQYCRLATKAFESAGRSCTLVSVLRKSWKRFSSSPRNSFGSVPGTGRSP